jgi:Ser/Thr protein kinase RdoA (MazF antagonist)
MRECGAAEDSPALLQQLAISALRRWGKEAHEIRLIKMRENAVFRIVDTRGASFALRVHRQGYHSDAALRSELQWMGALQHAGIDVPTLVPASDGRLFVSERVDGTGAPRQVDLLEWFDGRPLGSSEAGLAAGLNDVEQLYRSIGAIAARVHNHAVDWPLPLAFERHRWDLEGLVGDAPLWGRFWELAALAHDERALLMRARDRVGRELRALTDSADGTPRFGLIHADLVPENLLLSDAGRLCVIDFDDAGFGWHLFELATALYFIQDGPDYSAARQGLIDGYRRHRDLPDALIEKLPVFLAARSFTYLGWLHTRPASAEGRAIAPHVIRLACRQALRLLDTHKGRCG